ncbi:uncharacterized protein LOC126766959 [Bactrocera neohumeralis]|uniref:uncharacterized protein LOC126766959 n=1 Tax=Bactrocera neohumeralis TaxID=98809 RepID=UPI0021662D15|nr:uncharacterized protein LOC126766959 [Bactrocera neohumeralis]
MGAACAVVSREAVANGGDTMTNPKRQHARLVRLARTSGTSVIEATTIAHRHCGMRDRRRPRGPGGDAFTNRALATAARWSGAAARNEGESRDAIIAEHSQKIKAEQRRIMGEDKAIWDCRPSLYHCDVRHTKALEASERDVKHRNGHTKSVVPGEAVEVAALPEGCKGQHCRKTVGRSEAFGVVLGSHGGVEGYSNCYAHTCISLLEHTIEVRIPRPRFSRIPAGKPTRTKSPSTALSPSAWQRA